jgi:hypothetical protein
VGCVNHPNFANITSPFEKGGLGGILFKNFI